MESILHLSSPVLNPENECMSVFILFSFFYKSEPFLSQRPEEKVCERSGG